MQIEVQTKLFNDKKMSEYLKQNSQWFKYLNREPNTYNEFTSSMKDKYKLRTTDKMTNLVENIDLISSVLNVIK